MSRRNIRSGPAVMEERRQRAGELAEARSKRSAAQQLALLDERLGVGVGAVKERKRLEQEMSAASAKPASKGDGERRGKRGSKGSTAKERRERDKARGRRGGVDG